VDEIKQRHEHLELHDNNLKRVYERLGLVLQKIESMESDNQKLRLDGQLHIQAP